LISEPALLAGTASISLADNQVSFDTQNLQPNSPLVVSLQFEPGSLISAPANWQAEQETEPMPIGITPKAPCSPLPNVARSFSRNCRTRNGTRARTFTTGMANMGAFVSPSGRQHPLRAAARPEAAQVLREPAVAPVAPPDDGVGAVGYGRLPFP